MRLRVKQAIDVLELQCAGAVVCVVFASSARKTTSVEPEAGCLSCKPSRLLSFVDIVDYISSLVLLAFEERLSRTYRISIQRSYSV